MMVVVVVLNSNLVEEKKERKEGRGEGKEARREEILKISNYKEHCIRGYLAQHPHFIDYGRIKGE